MSLIAGLIIIAALVAGGAFFLKTLGAIAGGVVGLLVFAGIYYEANYIRIDQREVGVKYGISGKIETDVMKTGGWKGPFESVETVSMRPHSIHQDMLVYPKERLDMPLKVTTTYHIRDPGCVVPIYKGIGKAYQELINPRVEFVVKSNTVRYAATGFDRADLRTRATSGLQEDLDSLYHRNGVPNGCLQVDEVIVTNITLPTAVTKRIQQVVEAEQEAKQAEAQVAVATAKAQQSAAPIIAEAQANLKAAKLDAQATVAEARARADGQRLLSQTWNDKTAQRKMIDAYTDFLASVKTMVVPPGTVLNPDQLFKALQTAPTTP